METRKVQPEAHELKEEKQFDLYRREKDQKWKRMRGKHTQEKQL